MILTRQTARRQTVILLLLLALLALLNAPRLALDSYWADECYTIGLTQLTLPQLAEQLSTDDAHPPLHDFLLTWAVRLFGASPVVVQGLSLLAVLGLGALGATWVRRRFGFRCAAAFLLLLIFTRSVIDYATEVRMYAWSLLLVTACMAFAYELMHSDKLLLWAGLVFMAVAAAYAHYYALVAVAFVFLGLFFYRLWVLPRAAQIDAHAAGGDSAFGGVGEADDTNGASSALDKPAQAAAPVSTGVRCLWRFMAAGLACAAGYAPWLSILFSQLGDGMENWWMIEIPPLQSFLLFAFGWQATGYVLFALALGLLAAYFLAAARISCSFSLAHDGTRRFCWRKGWVTREVYFVAWGLGVLLGVLCVGLGVSVLLRPSFLERYLFPSVGILLLCVAIAVSKLAMRRKTVVALAAVLVLTGALNYAMVWRDEATFAQNTHEALSAMTSEIAQGDTLVSDSDHLYWALLPHYFPGAQTANADAFDWNSDTKGALWLCDTGGMMERGLGDKLSGTGHTAEKMGQYTLHWYGFTLYRIS